MSENSRAHSGAVWLARMLASCSRAKSGVRRKFCHCVRLSSLLSLVSQRAQRQDYPSPHTNRSLCQRSDWVCGELFVAA